MKSIDLLHELKEEMHKLHQDLCSKANTLSEEKINTPSNLSKYTIGGILEDIREENIIYNQRINSLIREKYIGDNLYQAHISWKIKIEDWTEYILKKLDFSTQLQTKWSKKEELESLLHHFSFPFIWMSQFEGRDLNAYFIPSPIPLIHWNMSEFFVVMVKKNRNQLRIITEIMNS